MNKDEALKLALEYVELVPDDRYNAEHIDREALVTAIKEALMSVPDGAQPEQEPVAWMREGWGPDCGPYIEFYRDDEMGWRDRKEWTALYTSAQRTWVNATTWRGLTDEEVIAMSRYDLEYAALIGEVQRRLKEKNT